MIIRSIEKADLEQLLPLCREHADYEGLPFEDCEQTARWETALFGEPAKLFGWVCAARDGSTALTGYMTATVDYATWSASPFVYLDCLYLKPEARRAGLGRRLMQTLQDFAASKGCAEIQWQTPPTNAIGISFYRSIGARELEKMRFSLPAGEGGRA